MHTGWTAAHFVPSGQMMPVLQIREPGSVAHAASAKSAPNASNNNEREVEEAMMNLRSGR
jgi:hypothetical protein